MIYTFLLILRKSLHSNLMLVEFVQLMCLNECARSEFDNITYDMKIKISSYLRKKADRN